MIWLTVLKWLKNPYIIAGLIIFSGFVYYEGRISYLKGKVSKKERALIIAQQEFINCQRTNDANQKELSKAIAKNNELINQWAQVQEDNALAVELIKQAKKAHDREIKSLKKQIKPIQDCDSMFVSSEHVELLKQASNNKD